MKIYFTIILAIFFLTRCSKEEIPLLQTDDNGVFISLPYQWRKSLHENGVFHSNGYFNYPIIYNQNIAIPTTDDNGIQYITMINTTKGEILWQWNDIFEESPGGDMGLYSIFKNDNLLTWQVGSRSYCVNLENGATHWKIKREKGYEPRIHPYNNNYYFTISWITRADDYDEHIAYEGNIQTGELTEFLRANYSCEYVGPITDNGWVGGITNIIKVPSNNNLLAVTYAEPLPEWVVRSLFGLYNTESNEWIYERKLMAPPLWNTSVYWPQIYNNKLYATVGNNLVCHDISTGEQVWKRQFDQDFLFSGFIIEDDKIIANNENLTLYCLDPETGYDLWTGEGAGTSSRMSYLNGIVYFVGGSDSRFHAVDIETGQTVWRIDAKKLEGSDGKFKTNAVYVIPGENGNKGKIIALTHMYAYCFEAYQ